MVWCGIYTPELNDNGILRIINWHQMWRYKEASMRLWNQTGGDNELKLCICPWQTHGRITGIPLRLKVAQELLLDWIYNCCHVYTMFESWVMKIQRAINYFFSPLKYNVNSQSESIEPNIINDTFVSKTLLQVQYMTSIHDESCYSKRAV